MGYSINRSTKIFRLKGADTLNSPASTHLLNPDLTIVGIPDFSVHAGAINTKYWKITGDNITLMDQSEKDAEDARISSELLDGQRADYKAIADLDKLFKAFAQIVLDEINLLRVKAGLSVRTIAQLKTAIKNQIDLE